MNYDESQDSLVLANSVSLPTALPPEDHAAIWTSDFQAEAGYDIWASAREPEDSQAIQAYVKVEIGRIPDHESPADAHALPFAIDSTSVSAALRAFLQEVEPDGAADVDLYDGEIIAPLDLDSTRDIWSRLTNLQSKRIFFRGSNTQQEVVAIVRGWTNKARNQPSWSRPVSMQLKKNRESIGPALFGWDRTDMPAWHESPKPSPKLPSFAAVESDIEHTESVEANKDTHSDDATVDDDLSKPHDGMQYLHPHKRFMQVDSALDEVDDSFGEFQSPPLPSAPFDNASFLDQTSKKSSSTPAIVQGGLLSPMLVTPSKVPPSDDFHITSPSSQRPEVSEHKPSSDPWDLSIFEQQINQKPIELQSPKIVTAVDEFDTPLRARAVSKTRQEIENESTVARVTALLPDITYFLA